MASSKTTVKILLLGTAAILIVGFFLVVLWRTFFPGPNVWTNDATLTDHYTSVAPRVSGQISNVLVNDNESVKAGQPLVKLDPRDYQAALESAEAGVASAKSMIADDKAELAEQPSAIDSAKAVVKKDKTEIQFAQLDASRFQTLYKYQGASQEEMQQATTSEQSDNAQLASDQAKLAGVQKQTKVLQAKIESAQAQLENAQAALRQARLNLSYTTIRAPIAGVVGEKAAQVGNYVGPGVAVMAIVPLHLIYIVANYRETQITHVEPGQTVSVHVDAFPHLHLVAYVASLAPATGVTFSPVAPDNATGNFTKVVQRLPIKIVFAPHQPGLSLLKDGLSVETTIHTQSAQVHDNRQISHGVHDPQ